MGSIDKACISGFLCRLCSEMHRTVIHIYGDQGQKHGLLEKINGYLPVLITPTDPLPKTICETCMKRVEQHYELLIRITKYREVCPRVLRVGRIPNETQTTASSTERRITSMPQRRTTSSNICPVSREIRERTPRAGTSRDETSVSRNMRDSMLQSLFESTGSVAQTDFSDDEDLLL